jgi:ATP-dependent DNA helicase PIF1
MKTQKIKKNIPKRLKDLLWQTYFGREYQSKCCVPKCNRIIFCNDFHAGHKISEKNGGETKLDNLIPLCSQCNLSMSFNNYDDWISEWGLNEEIDQKIEIKSYKKLTFQKKEIKDNLDEKVEIKKTDDIYYNLCKKHELIEGQKGALRRVYENKNVLITGPGGTGKSHLIKSIYEMNELLLKNTIVLAFTGSAAKNVNGMTIHKFMCLLDKNKPVYGLKDFYEDKYSLESDRDFFKKVIEDEAKIKLNSIIIDEISMVDTSLFEKLNKSLQKYYDTDELFANKQIILVGDFLQLSPIGENKKFIFESELWNQLISKENYIELEKNMRQKNDNRYLDFLNNLRLGYQTKDDKFFFNNLIKDKKEIRKDVMQLFYSNKDIENYNYQQLYNNFNSNEIITFEAEINIIKGNYYKDDIIKIFNDFKNISKNLQLSIGCKVIVTKNLNIKDGVVNGLQAFVIDIDDVNKIIKIKYDNDKTYDIRLETYLRKTLKLNLCQFILTKGKRKGEKCGKNKCKNHINVGTNIEYRDLNVEDKSDDIEDDNDIEKKLEIKQFPLKLGYAMSIHKSQGLTFESLDVHLPNYLQIYKNPGLIYVALSRCKKSENLRLFIDYPEQFNFYAIVPNQQVLQKIYNAKQSEECACCGIKNQNNSSFSWYKNICDNCCSIPIDYWGNYSYLDYIEDKIPKRLEQFINENFLFSKRSFEKPAEKHFKKFLEEHIEIID